MDDWKKLNEALLPENEDFYSHLNMEDITDANYLHENRVCKGFEIKNLGEYHDFHVQGDTLFLADVFENFRNMCIRIYKLNPAKFLSAPALAWKAALKTTKVKLDALTDIDILLMVGKGIRGGICHSIYRHAKANNKYIKSFDKNKELPYLQHLNVNNLYCWAMSQKLPVNNFGWIKDTSQFKKDFIKTIMKNMMKDFFLKLMFSILKSYMNFIMIYHF